jgi:hypothetical protein
MGSNRFNLENHFSPEVGGVHSSEMLVTTYKITHCHNSEDHNQQLCHMNLKSHACSVYLHLHINTRFRSPMCYFLWLEITET